MVGSQDTATEAIPPREAATAVAAKETAHTRKAAKATAESAQTSIIRMSISNYYDAVVVVIARLPSGEHRDVRAVLQHVVLSRRRAVIPGLEFFLLCALWWGGPFVDDVRVDGELQ